MFSCEEFRAELSNVVDEEIPGSLRRLVEHHLTECRACRILYDSTRKTLTILTEAGSFELEPRVSERLAARILASLKERD
ncbi:MAG TPA: zf-HC2 domain-containing protein [Thermoanaerobaculia bacterium]